jgi:hypothetical protein
MNRTIAAALGAAIVLLPSMSWAAPDPGKDALRKEYALPVEKDAPVIEYNQLGGLTPLRVSQEPLLTIYADGRVKMPACYKGQQAFEGKIPVSELQEILGFAIEKQKFFDYDEKKFQEKLAKLGQLIPPTDSITTTIRIQADGRDKSVSHMNASTGSKIEEVRQFAAVKQRVDHLKGVLRWGGNAVVSEYLNRANALLLQKHPEAKPLASENLSDVSVGLNGARSLSWVRRVSNAAGETIAETSASVYIPAGGEAKIQVGFQPEAK